MADNFGFIAAEWPETHADCRRAEDYGRTDPRSSAFYARRALEQVVVHVFDLARLTTPYRSDLAARIGDPAFQQLVGPDLATKCTLVRRVGNVAVHENRAITEQTALNVLRELHHVVVWAAYRFLRKPDQVPTARAYDPSQIPSPAESTQPPLSQEELNRLLATFEAKDAALAQARDANEQLQRDLDRIREEVRAGQAAKTIGDDHDYDEAHTRTELIDLLLWEAGWSLGNARDREYEVSGMVGGSGQGFVDYVLWGLDGRPLAVVEAKRTSRDPLVGQQQAKQYADCLEAKFGRRPVIFCTNGLVHQMWDDAGGYPIRQVAGFFTRDELELMIQRRQTRQPLRQVPVDAGIVERHYQQRAVRSVDAAFESKQRSALLVMATGSGKTRTVIALVEQLMKAGWVKRVLFLADRVALVNQAAAAFREHLPSATTVNLVTDRDTDGRVYVATYPTMMNLVDRVDDQTGRRFGPGHFDLVVIDEAHRSVYAKYGAIFEWFDSLLVGLTATPKDEIDRNTYGLFQLENGVPTDAYDLEDAVAEGFLVPPRAVSIKQKFIEQGISYDDLSDDEKDDWDSREWDEDGEVPDAVSADELNRILFNADTVDKVIATLMERGHKVAGGDRIAKTIVFAKNNDHAKFIRERFDVAYPELAGHSARAVTYRTERVQSLIDDFAQADKQPDIAISVDMLDTGIDVPEVANLVFFKVVRSKSKFWQMIGRGTRLRPDLYGPGEDKRDFFVLDFCGNLAFFSTDPPTTEGSLAPSLGERVFATRVALVAALDATDVESRDGDGTESVAGLRRDTADELREVVAGMNAESFVVRPHRWWVEKYADPASWRHLDATAAGDVVTHLAGLPSAAGKDEEGAKRFDLLLLRIQLATLESDVQTADRLRRTVQEIAHALLDQHAIPAVAAQLRLIDEIAGDEWWVDVTLPMLELARRRLRGLVQLIEKVKRGLVYTDFEDELQGTVDIDLPMVGTGTDKARFREKARAYLRAHEDHVALQRLRRNRQLTQDDLDALEQMLVEAGGTPADIAAAREDSLGLGIFVRSLVGLDREAATEAFSRFLLDSHYTAHQIDFVELIVENLTVNGVMEPARLYDSPFVDRAPRGPDMIFGDDDVEQIVIALDSIRAHAVVGDVLDASG